MNNMCIYIYNKQIPIRIQIRRFISFWTRSDGRQQRAIQAYRGGKRRHCAAQLKVPPRGLEMPCVFGARRAHLFIGHRT